MGKDRTIKTIRDIVQKIEVNEIDKFTNDLNQWLKFIKTGKSKSPIYKEAVEIYKNIAKSYGIKNKSNLPKDFININQFQWNGAKKGRLF